MYAAFDTSFGRCCLAWNETALTGFWLPEHGGEPLDESIDLPGWVRATVGRVRCHFAGQLQDFSDVPLDWSRVSDFQNAVYRQTLAIRPGFKMSYGEIARAMKLGPEGSRAVGAALSANPWPLIVPCHRVVSASDKMTGFSAPGGIRTKTRLLVLEGAELLSD